MTTKEILSILDRDFELFKEDVASSEQKMQTTIQKSKFLVLGGAGSIGQAVTKELFKRNPLKLHVVDISENTILDARVSKRFMHDWFRFGEWKHFGNYSRQIKGQKLKLALTFIR